MDLYKGFVAWVLEKFNFFPISTIFSHLLRAWVKCDMMCSKQQIVIIRLGKQTMPYNVSIINSLA